MRSQYFRKKVFSIQDVLSKITPLDCKEKVLFDDIPVNMNSERYHLFSKSLTCVSCGIEGQFFGLETIVDKKGNFSQGTFHFNLYAINSEGKEVLMTKDHIIPRSKGGEDHLNNYQTMCYCCNQKKGSNMS